MKLTADYHTHTVFSHGKGGVEDNIAAALGRGLETVGITDHSVAHFLYGIRRRRLADYMARIEDAKRAFADRIAVKSGIELNLTGLDGSVDMPRGHGFDIVIMGYHKAAVCRDLGTAWAFAAGRQAGKITQAYMRAIQRHRIDIVSHPGYGVPVSYGKLAQACADYGTLFEINDKHGELTEEALREAARTGVKFVVSSDAHQPAHVGLAPKALALCARAGIAGQIVNIAEG